MNNRHQSLMVEIRSHIAMLREHHALVDSALKAVGDTSEQPSLYATSADMLERLLDEFLAARRVASGVKYSTIAEIANDRGISPDDCFHAMAALGLVRGNLTRHRATIVGQRLSTSDDRWDIRVRDMIEAQLETWRASTDTGLFLRAIADAESSMGNLK
ncbi:hypothetical protein [Achromobacter sp. 2789STDY5608628]|uniref:hypothetical protein n=1 Tax=Achromobacter sp. 2789STDY5608628 TaxID=1806493 RepID=UPI0006C4A6DE|nr:hypothetical protein [Achromobacter sp. 2789STDY5608628]CUJ67897.1 Uncharacterised protein [Achromobacter sp. 2789STDY5608628]